jgi:hypothetical protein
MLPAPCSESIVLASSGVATSSENSQRNRQISRTWSALFLAKRPLYIQAVFQPDMDASAHKGRLSRDTHLVPPCGEYRTDMLVVK